MNVTRSHCRDAEVSITDVITSGITAVTSQNFNQFGKETRHINPRLSNIFNSVVEDQMEGVPSHNIELQILHPQDSTGARMIAENQQAEELIPVPSDGESPLCVKHWKAMLSEMKTEFKALMDKALGTNK